MRKFSCLDNSEKLNSNQNAAKFENWNQFYERGVSDEFEINYACFFNQNFDQFLNQTYAKFARCLFLSESKNRRISYLLSHFRNKQFELFASAKSVFFNLDFDQLWLSLKRNLRDLH